MAATMSPPRAAREKVRNNTMMMMEVMPIMMRRAKIGRSTMVCVAAIAPIKANMPP